MKDLNSLFDQCMKIVLDCGIYPEPIRSIEVNDRAKGRFGQCQYRYDWSTDTFYCNINVSSEILRDEANEDATKSVIIHEILHAANRGEGHKGGWKRDAETIREYTGIKINRCDSYENLGIERPVRSSKYQVVCTKCGCEFGRDRMSKLIKHPEDYRCGACHGRLKRVK